MATQKYDWKPVNGIQEIHVESDHVVVSSLEFDMGDRMAPLKASSAKAVARVDNNGFLAYEVGVAVVVFDGEGNVVAAGSGGSKLGPFTSKGQILLPHDAPTVIAIAALDAGGAHATGQLRSDPGGFRGRLTLAGTRLVETSATGTPASLSACIAVVPAGLLARATRAVSSGTSTPRRGQIDIPHSSGISRDSCPRKTGPGRHCSQPNTKIPDRVKLRRPVASSIR